MTASEAAGPGRTGVAVVVLGAGSGTRLGMSRPKAFVDVAGRPTIVRALESVYAMREASQVVVAVPADLVEEARSLVPTARGHRPDSTVVTAGGATRQASVSAALDLLGEDIGVVLVHDAARPLTPPAVFDAVVDAVRATGEGAIPGLPVTDTVKRVAPDDVIVETVDRAELVAVQTPQGFPRDHLVEAHAAGGDEHTDDAALVQASGHRVRIVAGDPLALKITTPFDLRRAEAIVAPPAPFDVRVGTGVDVHGVDPDAALWLAGLHWPGEPGLAGHSDGDAVCHAVCDALLAAGGLGDIGGVFGTADARFTDAHGDVFLRSAVERLAEVGLEPVNVSVQVVGNRPKLAPRREEAQRLLSEVVGAPVSLSATTTDGLGFTGRGEGVAAIATALVRGRPAVV